jgi:hypothetical protein
MSRPSSKKGSPKGPHCSELGGETFPPKQPPPKHITPQTKNGAIGMMGPDAEMNLPFDREGGPKFHERGGPRSRGRRGSPAPSQVGGGSGRRTGIGSRIENRIVAGAAVSRPIVVCDTP